MFKTINSPFGMRPMFINNWNGHYIRVDRIMKLIVAWDMDEDSGLKNVFMVKALMTEGFDELLHKADSEDEAEIWLADLVKGLNLMAE